MIQPGDIVRFLNDVGGGRVSRIDGQIAYVEDSDGFETPTQLRELVLIQTAEQAAKAAPKAPQTTQAAKAAAKAQQADKTASKSKQASQADKAVPSAPQTSQAAEPDNLPILQTAEGDTPNIILAFEPVTPKTPTHTDYYCTVVNDSNYHLFITIATRANEDKDYTPIYQNIIEPNIQELVDTFTPADVATFDNILIQAVLYKPTAPYAAQPVVNIARRMDTTKFYKLHTFKPNPYLDGPAITIDIIRDGKVADNRATETALSALAATPKTTVTPASTPATAGATAGATTSAPKADRRDAAMRRALRDKIRADRRPQTPTPHKFSKSTAPGEPIVVDLHIDSLLDTTAGMSTADILNYQVDTFRAVMDANLRNHGQKIIFIHGKGEGILRQALTKELNHRYKTHDACDASFQKYGYGATQVIIK